MWEGGTMSDTRDPYPDALRAIALLIVVLGHWVATLPQLEHGMLVETDHILDVWAPAGYFTWVVQVVPLFIFVAAAVSSEGVQERRRTGGSHLHWWAKRRSEEHTSELQSRPHLVCR